ncbi:MAG: cysteine desulfurase family protein [Bradymonadia bacterium]
MLRPIYLDHMATTPCDQRVFDVMAPFFVEHFGNASSKSHAYGWAAEEAVKLAREQVAALIGATPREIVFLSGASEGNNLAIKGAMSAYASKGNHIISQPTEHKAVLDTVKWLETQGVEVTWLPVSEGGRVSVDDVAAAIRPNTVIVSVMHANNELGTVNPIAEIGALCKDRGVLFHTDAAQTSGKLPIDVEAMGIDLLSMSGHKLYAPKGVGALYVRRRSPRVKLDAQMHGGSQERGFRSGTLAVPLLVALGAAAKLGQQVMADEATRLAGLRDRLWRGISGGVDGVVRNGDPDHCLPHCLHISIDDIAADVMMSNLRGLAISSGSACSSATLAPSHVLRAVGMADERAHASLRFGLGRKTTEAEVDQAIEQVVAAVPKVRELIRGQRL